MFRALELWGLSRFNGLAIQDRGRVQVLALEFRV